MEATPRRLARRSEQRELPLIERSDPLVRSLSRRLFRALRAGSRLGLLVGWTLLACVVQAGLLRLPGRGKVAFARIYWRTMCRLLGMRVRMVGSPGLAGRRLGRRVVYVSNHSSWLDILVLGGQLEACFVSKREVAGWPGIGLVARLGRTVFVSRARGAAGREERDMSARMRDGDDLILFPEGTSSDGSRVLPFHSTFFAVAKPPVRPGGVPAEASEVPIVQPLSLVYDRLGGLPVGRVGRAIFAWFGDMSLASHVWELAQWRGMRATILVHAPLDPASFASRKQLSAATWAQVAEGAALLRQNRPVRPHRALDAAGGLPGPARVPEERRDRGQGRPVRGRRPAYA